MRHLRLEVEVELNDGRRFLVYAELSKNDPHSDKCEVLFEEVISLNEIKEVSDSDLDKIAEILAYQYDDFKQDYVIH